MVQTLRQTLQLGAHFKIQVDVERMRCLVQWHHFQLFLNASIVPIYALIESLRAAGATSCRYRTFHIYIATCSKNIFIVTVYTGISSMLNCNVQRDLTLYSIHLIYDFLLSLCQVCQVRLCFYQVKPHLYCGNTTFWFVHRYPTNKWAKLGTFHARDERTVQSFPLDEHLYAKYVKVCKISQVFFSVINAK